MAKYTAVPFVAGSPEALVIGQTMLAFIENVEGDVVKPIMEKHGLATIDPEAWYSHQTWMDVLRELDETLGGSAQSTFVAIGREVVRRAVMPPAINSIPIALNALHAIHHANLKNIPEDEGYTVQQLNDKHFHVYANTPNPADAIYGFIWGICARFKQPNEQFSVKMLDNPHPDQIAGQLFDVSWG